MPIFNEVTGATHVLLLVISMTQQYLIALLTLNYHNRISTYYNMKYLPIILKKYQWKTRSCVILLAHCSGHPPRQVAVNGFINYNLMSMQLKYLNLCYFITLLSLVGFKHSTEFLSPKLLMMLMTSCISPTENS